jgi:NADH-quinone oxidoreductase subunit J
MLQAFAFWAFSTVMIISALAVIIARNPVHSVLFLIVAFFNAAALFVLLGAEFLGMVLLFVYVGAVALLFLSVVMMLDVDFAALKKGAMQYLVLGISVGIILFVEFIAAFAIWRSGATVTAAPTLSGISNTEALGHVLYTDYIFYFQTAGLILLVAMIGAIVLALRHRPEVRRQSISRQVAREPAKAIELVDVKPGQGG